MAGKILNTSKNTQRITDDPVRAGTVTLLALGFKL